MATGERDIVRRGYLSIVRNPKDGVFGSLTASVSSKRYWIVLRKETLGGGSSRLEFYRSEEQVNDPVRQILLNQIQDVQSAERRKAFEVHLPDDVSLFICSSKADMEDWVRDIRRLGNTHGSSSSSSFNGELPDNSVNGPALYEDIPNDETFRVRLRKSNSLMFSGPCLLEILRDFDRNIFHIAIFTEEEPPRLIVKWQIDHVRQYGSNRMAFKFQSGSKSPTGVDWFIMDTDPGAASRIHKSVDYWAKHIVDQVKNMTGGRVLRTTSVGASLPPRRVVSPTGSLPHSVYESLNPGTMQGSTVYDRPDQPMGKERSGTFPTPSSSSKALYQPLRPSKGGDSTYEDLNQQTREPDVPRGRSKNVPGQPGKSNAVYMDLNPQTRNSTDQSQYMGLKDARP